MRNPLIYRLARWGLALVFLYAGVMKLFGLDGFAASIADYGLVPDSAVYLAAVLLVALELLAGLGLVCDVRGALGLTVGLLALFSAVLSYGLVLGLEIECGCFGLGSDTRHGGSIATALLRDVALLAVCGYLYSSRLRQGIRPRRFAGGAWRGFHRKDSNRKERSERDERPR